MLGVGFIGAGTSRHRRRAVPVQITANISPATSPLMVGQRLSDTSNWSVITSPTNYATTVPGETIASVSVDFIGDVPDESTPFTDGQTNAFSITVRDTGATERTFPVLPRIVVYSTPPAFSTQPAFSAGAYTVGDIVTISEGVAGPGARLSIDRFELDGLDKSLDLLGAGWDTSGEPAGTLTLVVRATNSGGATLSNEVTAALGVPDVVLVTPLADQTLVLGTPAVTIDLRAVFANADPDGFSVTGPGASIDPDRYTLRLDAGTFRENVAITVTASNEISSVDDVFTLTVNSTAGAAMISVLSVTGAQAFGDLSINYTINDASGMAWGIGTGSAPSASELRAGANMTDFGTAVLTVGGAVNIALRDNIDQAGLNLWMVTDNSDTVVAATGSVPFAIDTQSPTGTLSGTSTGETPATGGLNLTDEAGDIADFAVYPTASTLSESDIEAGTGAAWSVQNVTLTAGGTNDQSATGLTAETGYRAWAVVVDAQGNKTTLNSTTFTTAAAPAGITDPDEISGLTQWYDPTNIGSVTYQSSFTTLVDTVDNLAAAGGSQLSASGNVRSAASPSEINGLAIFEMDNAVSAANKEMLATVDWSDDFTVAMVVNITATGFGDSSAVSIIPDTGGRLQIRAGSTGQFQVRAESTLHSQTTAGTDVLGDDIILVYRANGTTGLVDVFVNGTLYGSQSNYTPPTATTAELRLNKGSSRHARGHYGEFTRYEVALSDSDLNDLGAYLGSRWGMTWTEIT